MKKLLACLLALIALSLPCFAQTYSLGGMFTDSTDTVTLLVSPAGATQATLKLNHSGRYRHGWELDLIADRGGYCNYTESATISQVWTMSTNGVQVGTGSTSQGYASAGFCVPFDGQMDWAGSSGGLIGPNWRYSSDQVTLPIAQLGPTVSVFTDGSSTWSIAISCAPPPEGGSAWGQVTIFNESWWQAGLTVTYR